MYTIAEPDAGLTVERFLRRRGYSRALIVALKHMEDGLTLCGKRIFSVARLSSGDTLCVRMREERTSDSIAPVAAPVSMLYEDEDIFVIDKPAGMAVHPSQGNRECSLANALAALYAERGERFVFRAIGRLDKNTSGLVLLAKHALSACLLSGNAQYSREYLAICEGALPPSGTIDAPIGRADGSTICREIRVDGSPAVTHFERLHTQDGLSLAKVWIDTGRTHQIRVHMAHIGCPLAGDFLYNPASAHGARHTLHASALTLRHPLRGESISFSSPLPDDMRALLSPRQPFAASDFTE